MASPVAPHWLTSAIPAPPADVSSLYAPNAAAVQTQPEYIVQVCKTCGYCRWHAMIHMRPTDERGEDYHDNTEPQSSPRSSVGPAGRESPVSSSKRVSVKEKLVGQESSTTILRSSCCRGAIGAGAPMAGTGSSMFSTIHCAACSTSFSNKNRAYSDLSRGKPRSRSKLSGSPSGRNACH